MNVTQRLFLVGCPRSGTTIIQAAIAGHPKIKTFPETRYFRQAVQQFPKRFGFHPDRPASPWQEFLSACQRTSIYQNLVDRLEPEPRVRPEATACVEEFLDRIGRPRMIEFYPRDARDLPTHVQGFIGILDQLTLKVNKDIWLEKTPAHVLYLDVIEKYVPEAKFVHVVRSGQDVVASLADTLATNEEWQRTSPGLAKVENMVELWNRCYWQSVVQRWHRPNHHLISYEEFVANPEDVLRKICRFLGLGFQRSMLLPRGPRLRAIKAQGPAKRSIAEGIRPPEGKFETLFTQEEQRKILSRLVRQA